MNPSIARLDNHRSSRQHQTRLGQMCGTAERFRDRYQIVRVLGRGGFGVTFLAQDVSLPGEPLCVIKQLCPKTEQPDLLERSRQRFAREAAMLGQLGSHAQIPRLLDYFEEDNEFYLVQEYIHGRTLSREVKRSGEGLPEAEVKRFLVEILPVLSYIHRHRVIHRDIKPPNIIRSQDDGRLVLIDFGAVKEQFITEGTASRHRTTTHFIGTVGFAAPEQMSLRPTYASDIYALGVTCLYLLTGKPPIDFATDLETGELRWSDRVEVSDHFGKILSKMLKVTLRERYQSAAEVLRVLDLEPHLPQLSHCLTTQPPLPFLEDSIQEEYLPPTVRTALAIRHWRAKRLAKERPYWRGSWSDRQWVVRG